MFAAFLLVAALVTYSPAWFGLRLWDDDAHLTAPALQSWGGLARIWFEPGATQQYYPLVHSAFWLEHRLWGDAMLGYHLAGIFLHVGAGFLIMRILRQLEVPGAWLAAGIFVLHPIEVESVAWVTELKNTLSGVLYLGATLLYLKFDATRGGRYYALALGLFALGLTAKTVVASLPAALLVVFWWKRGTLGWKRDVGPLIPFFATGAAAGLFTAWTERKFIGATGPAFDLSFLERGLIAGRAIWFYLGKLLWPENLIFIYPRWHVDPAVWWQYLYPAMALGMTLALWSVRRRARWPLAAWLLFVGTLFPALGFINVYPFLYSFVADHFQYVAGIVPIAVVSAGAVTATRRLGNGGQRALGGALLVGLGLLSWRQSARYSDARALWETTLRENPSCWLACNNLGTFLFYNGETANAIRLYKRALELRPDYAEADYNAGNALAKEGDLDGAIDHYRRALELQSDYPEATLNLGVALARRGQIDEAETQFRRTVELQPDNAAARYNLGKALRQRGQLVEAIGQYEKSVALEPGQFNPQFDLAESLFQAGRLDDALAGYRRARNLSPQDAPTLNGLSWLLATSAPATAENKREAVVLAEQANQDTGGTNPVVLQTVAAAYANADRFVEAGRAAQRALSLVQGDEAFSQSLREQIRLYDSGRPLRGQLPSDGPP